MARILIVDDEEALRYTFESFLSDEGHRVVTAESLEAALSLLGESDFDLVFTDIILGDGMGTDILQVVRERHPICPVVMVTGYPSLETASQAVRLGAFDYIAKPVRQATLLDVAERALKHKALMERKERSRSRLEAIFRSVGEAIITVDGNKIITEVNEAAGEICGLGANSVGKHFDSVPRFGAGCLGLLDKALHEGKTISSERVECACAGRPKRVVNVVVSPLQDERNATIGAVLTVKDEVGQVCAKGPADERREFHGIVGKSEGMRQIYSLIEDLAGVPTTVLITGETGTGKELVAAALHRGGDRAGKSFVAVNCAALPENLLESELFGHVRGAFTGALQNKIGRFERAHGGTLFLDEIGDVSPQVQSRLLRVLQEKEFERVGDSRPVKVDVRVVAATNKDLQEKVRLGKFREDLYYRLKVMELRLPPLRERKEDIPLLVGHFLAKFNALFRKKIASVSAETLNLFREHPWPGNVRELEHALEHAFVRCNQNVIVVDHLPAELLRRAAEAPGAPADEPAADREAIIKALEMTDWNKAKAARVLGLSRQTMYRRLEEYGIKREGMYQ